MNLWRQICTIEYVLTQGYSDDVEKDEALLNYLRSQYEKYLKLTKIKKSIGND